MCSNIISKIQARNGFQIGIWYQHKCNIIVLIMKESYFRTKIDDSKYSFSDLNIKGKIKIVGSIKVIQEEENRNVSC